MHGIKKTIHIGIAASFLLGGVTANTWGAVGGGGGLGADAGGEVSGIVRIVGQVICSDCTLREAEAVYPDMVDLYQLSFNDGELAVMKVNSVNDREMWQDLAHMDDEIPIRGRVNSLQKLIAEENLLRELEIQGLLSKTTKTLDIGKITFLETHYTAAQKSDFSSGHDRGKHGQRSMTRMVQELNMLPLNKSKKFYRNALKKRGYRVTTIPTNSPQELDLEVQKRNKQMALNISFDEDTGRSTALHAEEIWWATNGQADGNFRRTARGDTAMRDHPAKKKSRWQRGKQVLERELTPGEDRGFYPDTLEALGYEITSVNVEDPDRLEYEIVKGQQTYEIHIDIDEDEDTATDIFIHRNRNRSADTRRFLKQQARQE